MLKPGLLYFAYGCNMDPAFLAEVVGVGLPPGWPARVFGWRLAFNKGGEGEVGGGVVANLVQEGRCCTYGVVYRLPRRALEVLDEFERAPEHYRREVLWVEPVGRRARQAAVAYIGRPEWIVEEGVPDPRYLGLLVRGAMVHGLPEAYVAWLRLLASGSAHDCYQGA